MKRKQHILVILIVLLTVAFPNISEGKVLYEVQEKEGKKVVSLGKDLTEKQQEEMLDLFGVGKEELEDQEILYITNEEERKYLSGYIDDKVIGTRAISSSYVENLVEGSGIDVEIYNVNWVTEDMLKSALVTAGVKDAKVKVASPINVSGTAALTGIIKAFEGATGTEVEEDKKKTANEEIAKTGKLAEEIGKEKASELVRRVKEEVIREGIKSKEDIRKVIVEITGDLNIKLDEKQLEEITGLMENISKLNINIGAIEKQLNNISQNIDEIAQDTEEVKGILQRILDFFRQIFVWLGEAI